MLDLHSELRGSNSTSPRLITTDSKQCGRSLGQYIMVVDLHRNKGEHSIGNTRYSLPSCRRCDRIRGVREVPLPRYSTLTIVPDMYIACSAATATASTLFIDNVMDSLEADRRGTCPELLECTMLTVVRPSPELSSPPTKRLKGSSYAPLRCLRKSSASTLWQ